MLKLAYPAQHDDDVILKAHLRCRSCFEETFPLVPVSRQPAGRSERVVFMAGRLYEKMPFHCRCGHTSADLVTVAYAQEDDVRPAAPEPKEKPVKEFDWAGYFAKRRFEVKPDLFPNLGMPRLLRCA